MPPNVRPLPQMHIRFVPLGNPMPTDPLDPLLTGEDEGELSPIPMDLIKDLVPTPFAAHLATRNQGPQMRFKEEVTDLGNGMHMVSCMNEIRFESIQSHYLKR